MVNSDLVQLTFTGTTWIVEGRKRKKNVIYLPAIVSKKVVPGDKYVAASANPTAAFKRAFTTEISRGESSVGSIPVCAEHHQQLVAPRFERGRPFSAAPAAQHGGRLAVAVVDRDGVVVALARQAVAVLQVHEGKEELDPVPGRLSDAPVAVDVVWVDAWKTGAVEGSAYCGQHLLALTCEA